MNELINEWKSQLKNVVTDAENYRKFQIIIVNESLARRTLDLSLSALAFDSQDGRLIGLIAARAIIETLAAQNRLKLAIEEREGAEVDKLFLGSRYKADDLEFPVEATNILTYLKKLEIKYTGITDFYNQLSEFAHPNMAGVVGMYCDMNFETKTAHMQMNKEGLATIMEYKKFIDSVIYESHSMYISINQLLSLPI